MLYLKQRIAKQIAVLVFRSFFLHCRISSNLLEVQKLSQSFHHLHDDPSVDDGPVVQHCFLLVRFILQSTKTRTQFP